jgi:carbamoyl-phosphate synthase small subunit
MSIYTAPKARLILADGTKYEGRSFGAVGTAVGEVVFTTGLTGWQETLTDPSYVGQIAVQTFPLIGNYGTNNDDAESDSIHMKGYIVREWCDSPSNFRAVERIDSFLKGFNTIGLFDIDTRALTRRIREHGVMPGAITTLEPHDPAWDALIEEINSYTITGAVDQVSCKTPKIYPAYGKQHHRVALVDFGYKRNIRESLRRRGCDVVVVPAKTDTEAMLRLKVEGVVLSNGPGDPAENIEVIENLRCLAAVQIPVMGICLGHQLLAHAVGGRTQKMRYGHRGSNQPVLDLSLGRTFVTTQNHGYEVVIESILPNVGSISHVNANSPSCEGITYHQFPGFSVQFHPEACAGPNDTAYLFDRFLDLIDEVKGGNSCASL